MKIGQIENLDEKNMITSVNYNDYKLKSDYKLPDGSKETDQSKESVKSEKKDKSASDSEQNADNNNKAVNVLDRTLRFEIKDIKKEDGKVEKKLIISVLDQETGEVIRTIPPEELKEAAKNLTDFAGLALDKLG